MKRQRSTRRHHERGAAALLVVIVLFFILAMVTAYAGRNLIFEQRTSVNNQRTAQAFEAAESGLDMAIGLLGGGRIDAQCASDPDGPSTFRQRHLAQDGNGNFTTPGAMADLKPTCMLLPDGARCSCPAAGLPALIVPVGGLVPAFQLHFETLPPAIAQPGVVRAVSRGCSSIGSECYAGLGNADAVAEVSVLLGLNSALATPPPAALTVRNTVDLTNSAVTIVNTDVPSHGLTIDAGGPIINSGNARLSSAPGTPGSGTVLASDPSLSSLLDGDRMFVSVFGMDRDTYRSQPAAVQVTCAGNCATQINTAISENPGRVVWVQGSTTIESELIRGTVDQPVMLVVHGDLTVSATVQLFGVLYLYGDGSNTWNTTAGSTLIQGAVVAEGNLSVVGTPTIVFNPAVLRAINLTQGSLVRIPGSWRDFEAGS